IGTSHSTTGTPPGYRSHRQFIRTNYVRRTGLAAATAAAVAATAATAATAVVTVGTHGGLRGVSRSASNCGPCRADRCTTGHENADCGNRNQVLQTLCLHDLYLLCFIDLCVAGRAIAGRGHRQCAA
ncbi:hypothetical protein AB0K74_45800, partial [Streptomyces sp. NPDC056159]|uniref:hypothetical protein n=1 Tax=Streptomyces sp. NPDC056159 TaxID=3155537 RepID=UPI003447EDB5